jgi:hypothetical protein
MDDAELEHLFGIALANAATTSLTLREVVQRERQAREDAQRAADEALLQAAQALGQQETHGQALDAVRRATAATGGDREK